MITTIVSLITYLIGCFISYWIMKTEHESEKETYTKGNQVVGILFSVLSWVMVIVLLVRSWFIKIGKTGYWDKPATEVKETKIEIKQVAK